MDDPNHPGHLRNWPRDGPIRWQAVAGAIARIVVRLVAVASHLVLGLVYVRATTSGAVGSITAWILAIGWVVLAAWLVWAWWFGRWRIVLPPLVAMGLLALGLGITDLSGRHF